MPNTSYTTASFHRTVESVSSYLHNQTTKIHTHLNPPKFTVATSSPRFSVRLAFANDLSRASLSVGKRHIVGWSLELPMLQRSTGLYTICR
jgi:hypothetical protein